MKHPNRSCECKRGGQSVLLLGLVQSPVSTPRRLSDRRWLLAEQHTYCLLPSTIVSAKYSIIKHANKHLLAGPHVQHNASALTFAPQPRLLWLFEATAALTRTRVGVRVVRRLGEARTSRPNDELRTCNPHEEIITEPPPSPKRPGKYCRSGLHLATRKARLCLVVL